MLLTLLVSMLGFGEASAQHAYALFTESTGELRFKYDSNYLTGQTYQLNSGDEVPGWYADGTYKKVERVVFDATFATVRPTSTYYWFYCMDHLNEIAGLANLNTSEVRNMSYMFYHCPSKILENLSFDTRNVTTMREMFAYCNVTALSLPFDTRNVTDMCLMFFNCTQLEVLDLSTFDTSKVEDMSSMFLECGALKTIYVGEGWDASNVSESSVMFEGCSSIVGGAGTTYNWQGTDKSFAHVDGGGANPGYLTLNDQYAVYDSFWGTLTFYCGVEVHHGTKYYLNRIGGREGWYNDGKYKNVSSVVFDPSFADARPTDVRHWFQEMDRLEEIGGIWENLNISEVTNLSFMFYKCSSLKNVDLSYFDTKNVTDMSYMFYGCSSLTTIYVGEGWHTDKVTFGDNMFTGCASLVGGRGTTCDAGHVDKSYAKPDGGPSAPGYLTWGGPYAVYANNVMTFYCDTERSRRTSETYELYMSYIYPRWYNDWFVSGTFNEVKSVVFDPSFAAARPTSTSNWFFRMTSLTSIQGIEYLNTSEVDDMFGMFGQCEQLKTLDLSGFNTSKLSTIQEMFKGCSELQVLNLSSFDTHHVKSMSSAFESCSKLHLIYVGDGWNMDNVTHAYNTFLDCFSLVGGKGTAFSEDHVDGDYAHVDGGPSDPGYLSMIVPYVNYNNGTLMFCKDMYLTTRPGTAYLLGTGLTPEWYDDGNYKNVSSVVFDPSFADARPTSTSGWFLEMSNLETVTGMKEYLNTSEVETMFGMFFGCSALKRVELSNFETQKVTMMNSMFNGCSSLTTLDLSSFNTESVSDMGYMFQNCSNLKTIYVLWDWAAQAVRTTYKMFDGCTSLVGGNGTVYDPEHTDGLYACVDQGVDNPGYLTWKTELPGDVNDDGQVGIGDIVSITNVMAGAETDSDIIYRADVNGDGEVGIGDIVSVTNIMAGMEVQ